MFKTQQAKSSVVIPRVLIEALLACSSLKDVKAILAMIIEHSVNGKSVECPEHLQPLWCMFKHELDKANERGL